MKRILCLSLCILTVLSLLSVCFATDTDTYEPPIDIDEYKLTSSVTASLHISGGTASCGGDISAIKSGASCRITVSLRQYQGGNSWKTLKSWTGSGTGDAEAGGTYTVPSGTYKVTVSATVSYDGSSETVTKSTANKTY